VTGIRVVAVIVAMIVRMRRAAAVGMRAIGWQIDDVAVAYAAFGNDVVGEFLHVRAAAPEHGDLETVVVVEMHVQRGMGEIVALVEIAR